MSTFCTFGTYSALDPYKESSDGRMALLAQTFIFFSLLASIALSFSPEEFGSATNVMDLLLTILLFTPVVGGVVLELAADLPSCVGGCCGAVCGRACWRGGGGEISKAQNIRHAASSVRAGPSGVRHERWRGGCVAVGAGSEVSDKYCGTP